MSNYNPHVNAPFPFFTTKEKLWVSLILGLFIYVFLITFQPFGISKIIFYKPIFLVGYAVITFTTILSTYILLPYMFKSFFDTEKWTVKKMLLLTFTQILLISILNAIYTATIGKEIVDDEKNLITFIFITFTIGIIPSVLLILLTEKLLSTKNQLQADISTKEIKKNIPKDDIKHQIVILGEEKNHLKINLKSLICIKSEGNYVSVYTINNDNIEIDLLRYPISRIIKNFDTFENIKKCHRSYIVNFDYMKSISGNARNYNIQLKHIDFIIPVSRNFSREYIDKMRK